MKMQRRGLMMGGLATLWPWPRNRPTPRPRHTALKRFPPSAPPPTLWYEDKDGHRLPTDFSGGFDPPTGSVCQVSRFSNVHTSYLHLNDDGTSTEIMVGDSSWSDDLALALATHGGYRLSDAVLIAGIACERCMNSLAYACGLDWGYPEGSEQWRRCGTECELCRVDVDACDPEEDQD